MQNGTDSIAELFKKYGEEVFRTCWMYLRDKEAAEDAAMDTFLRAMKSIGGFRGGSTEKTWLIKIAINVCKNALRSPARKRNAGSAPLEAIPVSGELYAAEEKAEVASALASLPEKYREAALLHFYNGFTVKECAKIAGVPQTTMEYRVKHAKELLRKALSAWYYEDMF